MRIIVTGGRDYDNVHLIATILARYWDEKPTIVHGDCKTGADSHANRIAKQCGYKVEPHPADWEAYGKGAGPLRNQEMADLGADLCIAFPGGSGTRDCVRRCSRAGIPIRRIGP